ncbi:alpha/beta fold hydrolase [Homoserinimonas sp. A520]
MNDQLYEYHVVGDGDTTIFMMHGAYGDGRYFSNTEKVLAGAGYRVVVWNAPGYGNTATRDDYSIDLAGDAAVELIKAEGTGTNILLGHSMGALIVPNAAMKLGGKAGGVVDGIVLSGASVGFQNRTPEDQKRFLAERLDPIVGQGQTVQQYAPGLLKSMMHAEASGPLVDHVYTVVTDMKTQTFVNSLRALTEYNATPALQAMDVPTLLLAGEFDTACPPAGMRKIADMTPDGEFHLIHDAGHYAFAEKPDVFHMLLLNFLARRFGSEEQ